jgi:hypothetical protein
VLVFYGGPINRAFVLVVHSTDYRQPETVGLDEHVAVTTSPEVIVDMGQARGPRRASSPSATPAGPPVNSRSNWRATTGSSGRESRH